MIKTDVVSMLQVQLPGAAGSRHHGFRLCAAVGARVEVRRTWRTFISVERNFTVYSQCNILIPIFFSPLPSSTKRVETVSCSYYHSVREVFVVHVGGTRGVTSSTDHIMNRQARITLTVACIPVFVYLYVEIQGRV